jgi:hypothetical protein
LGIIKPFRNWSVQDAHFTSWLLKDAFWCLKLPMFVAFMILPTTILTIYLFVTEKGNRKTNFVLSCWVFMNVFWMLHELYGTPFWVIIFFMAGGIIGSIYSIFR